MVTTFRHVSRIGVVSLAGLAALAVAAGAGAPAAASGPSTGSGSRSFAQALDDTGGHSADVEGTDELNSYAFERTAPALSVSGDALTAAEAQAAALPEVGGSWSQLTTNPDNAEPAGYDDPVWSNAGAGFRNVSGRVTALATDGAVVYLGAADGGVWRSTNKGATWTPVDDHLGTLSIGALAVNSADHSVWVGTGEANTNADSYAGQGVFRFTRGGSTLTRVGGDELTGTTVYRLLFDGEGNVYAATNAGLWRRSASNLTSPWQLVLKPQPNPTDNPYLTSFITDVVVRPGTNGAVVLAADGWRGAGDPPADTAYNGFYLSNNHGMAGTFHEITPTGDINDSDIGRTTFGYAADGSKLYAVIESPAMLLAGDSTVLQGIFVSENGNPTGPWTLIADSTKLCDSGSGLTCPSTYQPGVQAWYNESLLVDPSNPDHLVVGLEEEYQSFNSGQTWTTISPYWNYDFACDATNTCPATTHPDEHAVALDGSTLYIGNDGGVYSRNFQSHAPHGGWTDLNNSIHTLQYYDAEAGFSGGTLTEWGGLQDNGTTLLRSGAAQTLTPAGGDGGDVIVNPTNANDAVGEYVDMNPYLTTDGGHTFTTITPSCDNAVGPPITNCDPDPRFIAPLTTDVNNVNDWVTGGEDVWTDTAAWGTVCNTTTCDWTNVHDTGAGHSITALAVSGPVIYAAWCGPCNPGGSTPFVSGIDTNYGGTWHTISASNLPNRYISGLTVDPSHPGHIYVVYNGFSRHWILGGGVGHVFESHNGGATWTNISGDLPDVPSDALVFSHGVLALGTDIGAFLANTGGGPSTSWSRLGPNLPNASIDDLRLDPDGTTLLGATHGRGLWSIKLP
jgi:hypothetical protein